MSMQIGMFTSGYQRNPLEHCFQDAKEYGYEGNYVMGANIAGFVKVAEAMMAQGVV